MNQTGRVVVGNSPKYVRQQFEQVVPLTRNSSVAQHHDARQAYFRLIAAAFAIAAVMLIAAIAATLTAAPAPGTWLRDLSLGFTLCTNDRVVAQRGRVSIPIDRHENIVEPWLSAFRIAWAVVQ